MKILKNSQHHKALARIEEFIEKGFSHLTQTGTNELEKLSKAVEEYESKLYPLPVPVDISNMLMYYMAEHKINKTQLSRKPDISNPALNDIINGKKRINLSIAKKIHEKLNIDGNLILQMA